MIVETKRFIVGEDSWVSQYYGLSTDDKPVGHINGSTFIEMDTGSLYIYDEDNNLWRLQTSGGGSVSIVVHAESHETKEGFVIPVLTDEQIVQAYNGITAGNPVFVVNDTETLTLQVLDASSASEDVSITVLFGDKLILTYQVEETTVATPIGGGGGGGSDVFVVVFESEDGDEYTCNKTYSEIEEAYNSGKGIVAMDKYKTQSLTFFWDWDGFAFEAVNCLMFSGNQSTGGNATQIKIDEDNNITAINGWFDFKS